jgi:hypothetical protein
MNRLGHMLLMPRSLTLPQPGINKAKDYGLSLKSGVKINLSSFYIVLSEILPTGQKV